MSHPVVTVENLSKRYQLGQTHADLLSERLGNILRRTKGRSNREAQDEFWALRDVSFEIEQGEVLGIIGRNGAGKSTLLKILSRITAPTTGRVEMRGRVASLLEVGTGFHPELTGRENIFLNGAILGMSRSEIARKFDEIVAFAEVDRFIDTPVKRYSSGMYVRLAFSVAAHLEPEILIVDEVLAVGDAAFQKKCMGKMEHVAQAGRTVFFVSHNMASIRRLCSGALHLRAGSAFDRGNVLDVVRAYIEENTAGRAETAIMESMHRVKSPFQVRGLELIGLSGQQVGAFEYGEPVALRLLIDCREPMEGVRIGVGLVAEGVRVATMLTPTLDFLRPSAEVTVTCQLEPGQLLPGFFSVHLGAVLHETGKGLDWVPDAATFQVLDVSSKHDQFVDEREIGIVQVRHSWMYSTMVQPSYTEKRSAQCDTSRPREVPMTVCQKED